MRLGSAAHALPVLALAAGLCGWPTEARAWKIETHIWIAQEVLNDLLAPDGTPCAVTIAFHSRSGETGEPTRREYLVERAICDALAAYQAEYRMGAVGPDGFPDLVGGQQTTHPGVPGGWQTDRWLQEVLAGARRAGSGRAPATAFAYGYLTHAAGDIFAHTYVNSYAGDLFDLEVGRPGSEQHVELRHMALEGYIKAHNPDLRGPDGRLLGRPEAHADIRRVAAFIRDQLLLNPQAAAQYRTGPATAHLAAMFDFWEALGTGIQEVDDRLAALNAAIAAVQASIQQAQDRIDDLKNTTVCVLGYCLKIYPAACLVDPLTCATILSLEFGLRTTTASLELARTANVLTALSIRGPLEIWRAEVENALTEYILMSQNVAIAIMRTDLDPPANETASAQVTTWLCRYGPTFGAVPSQLAGLACQPSQQLSRLRAGIDELRSSFHGAVPWVAAVVDPIGAVGERISRELDEGLLARLAEALLGEDSAMVSLAHMRERKVNQAALNDEFSKDLSGKHLLVFPDVAALVDEDMHVTTPGQPFDPERFHAVYDAIVMSKLLLLGPAELNRLARDSGVHGSIYGTNLYTAPAVNDAGGLSPFNVLFEAVRSIDGNHQWQPFGLPYPRRVAVHQEGVPFGYAFDSAARRGGFRLWQDCEARAKVFERIFRGPVAPALSPVVLAIDPGWESEEAPFPVSPFQAPAGVAEVSKLVTDPVLGRVWLCGPPPADGEPYLAAPSGYVAPSGPDDVPPTLVPPPALVVECTANGASTQAFPIGEAVAVDDRDSSVAVWNDAPAAFAVGLSRQVNWYARDAAGNLTQATQLVAVRDSQPPEFLDTLPTRPQQDGQDRLFLASVVRATATSPSGAVVPLPVPRVRDACRGTVPAVTVAPSAGRTLGRLPPGQQASWHVVDPPEQFPIGRTLVPWATADVTTAGVPVNIAIAWQIVDVEVLAGDLNIDGVVNGQDLDLLLADLGTTLDPPALRDFNDDGTIDEIDEAFLQLLLAHDADPRDLNGDYAVDVQDVRALIEAWSPSDTTPPTIVCGADVAVPNSPGEAGARVTFPVPSAVDDLPGVAVTVAPASGSFFPIGPSLVTATARDVMGNEARCSFGVTVTDVEPPVITAPGPVSREADALGGAVVPDVELGVPLATDNAPGVRIERAGVPAGHFFPLGTTVVTYAAIDGAGNRTTASQEVTVVDTTPPVVTIRTPAGAYVLNQQVHADYDCVDVAGPVASCVGDVPRGATLDMRAPGAWTFTAHAADAAGNVSSRSAAYTVSYALCVPGDEDRAVRAGSTLPVKLRLCDASGANVSSPDRPVKAVRILKTRDATSTDVLDAGHANPDQDFRYDAELGGYIFNLSTLGLTTGTYSLAVRPGGDPRLHTILFSVK